ncbi:hypothetical protein VZT92_010303 [Zoarces viviparus]|uniref:Uncharacterized protein n=1 Tax=Zoarces viviparus TaxID=48416 RepID=A0AAW1FEQ2_ZOAVI
MMRRRKRDGEEEGREGKKRGEGREKDGRGWGAFDNDKKEEEEGVKEVEEREGGSVLCVDDDEVQITCHEEQGEEDKGKSGVEEVKRIGIL